MEPIDLLVWLAITLIVSVLAGAGYIMLRLAWLARQASSRTYVASPHGPLPVPTDKELDAAHKEFGAPPLPSVYCGATWPRDIEYDRTVRPHMFLHHRVADTEHRCVLAQGHGGMHVCACMALDYSSLADPEGDPNAKENR